MCTFKAHLETAVNIFFKVRLKKLAAVYDLGILKPILTTDARRAYKGA